MITLKVRNEDFAFQVPSAPGIYEVLDVEGYVAVGFLDKFYFVHDGLYGMDLALKPESANPSDFNLASVGMPIVNGLITIG